jgi:hypothetical protein
MPLCRRSTDRDVVALGLLCDANANLTRADQPGELMRFVEFWQGLTGHDPEWLYFDSKVVPYPELSRLNQRGIHLLVTLFGEGCGSRRVTPRSAGSQAIRCDTASH